MLHDTPEVLFLNGNVRTMDDVGSVASAVAVRHGRITAVGSSAEMLETRSAATEVIDLRGRTLLPAFTDSHTHFRMAALAARCFIDFSAHRPTGIPEILAVLRERVGSARPGTWIRGENLLLNTLREARPPNRHELDAVSRDLPITLYNIGNHVVAANSRALALAGIDRTTADPTGGRIDRDAEGEPTGILYESAKLRLDPTRADSVVPPVPVAERLRALAEYSQVALASGIAGIHEIVRTPDEMADFQRLREIGGLTLRVRFYIRGLEATTRLEYLTGAGIRSEFGDDWLKVGGVKFSIDGLETAHNAAMFNGYADDPGNNGIIRIPEDDLREAVQEADRSGLQVAIHAIGPRAVDIALGCFEAIPREAAGPQPRLRHRLEHSYMPMEARQWERIARLSLLWSTQPSFLRLSGDVWTGLLAPDDRAGRWLPLRHAHDLDITTLLNSDHACSPLSPLIGIQTAVTRSTETGTLIDQDQAVSVDYAIRCMTNNPAIDSRGATGPGGSVEAGKLADLIVLSADPYTVPPSDISDIDVELTMVDGVVRHGAA